MNVNACNSRLIDKLNPEEVEVCKVQPCRISIRHQVVLFAEYVCGSTSEYNYFVCSVNLEEGCCCFCCSCIVLRELCL